MSHVEAYIAALRTSADNRALEGKYDPAKQADIPENVLLDIWMRALEQFLQVHSPETATEFLALSPGERTMFFDPDSVYGLQRFTQEFMRSAIRREGAMVQ